MSSVIPACPAVDAFGVLSRFRQDFYASLYTREDALFELTDALLCAEGPVKALVELSLAAEHRRSHGGMYAALTHCTTAHFSRRTPTTIRTRRASSGTSATTRL